MATTTKVCSRCRTEADLRLINCSHEAVCFPCGRSMCENKEICSQCGIIVTRLLQEFDVRAATADDMKYFLGRFHPDDVPNFTNGHGWSLGKNNVQDPESSSKKEPLALKDETDDIGYQGLHVDPETASPYFLLVRQDDGSFVAIPDVDWYGFTRVKQSSNQLTTEQAEAKMQEHSKKTKQAGAKMEKHLGVRDHQETSSNEEGDSVDEKGEDWEYEATCSDDNEEDKEADLAETLPVPKAFEENDNDAFLSHSGQDMKNLLALSKKRFKEESAKEDTSAAEPSEKKTKVEKQDRSA